MILFASKSVRNYVKRLHPLNIQIRVMEIAPVNERLIPQYYIYKNLQRMQFLRP